MTAVLLALGASFGWGCSDFIAGVKTRALPVLSVLLVSQAAGLVLALGAAVTWGGALPGGESVAWAVAAGGAELVGFAALYPLTTVFLAFVVLRERVSGPQGLGAATALAGVGLVAAAT